MAAKGTETRVATGDADTYIVRSGLEKATSHPKNCSSMTIHLPRDTQFFQSGPFAIEDEIGGVNLSHNHLQSLERNHLRGGIRHLFLDNNHLRKPPLSLLYYLENLNNVTLSGNPWS
ncbi:hypothetical protein AVEN_77726-1, partial [Araneus ventricosus]